MNLSALRPWSSDTADLRREEDKRWNSPSSFFYSQGRALVLAAGYFTNDRLARKARGGVALKHRHRIHLAIFGQLMASLEYMLKDFVAQVIDLTSVFDHKIKKAKWIEVDADRVLSARTVRTSSGSLLLHSTMGWHEPEVVNGRYSELFGYQPIDPSEIDTLKGLWILRHSVAHNAGLMIAHDAARAGLPQLSNEVVDVDSDFVNESFEFLCGIAKRLAEGVGDRVVVEWLRSRASSGKDYRRDKQTYTWLKRLASFVQSRAEGLPKITKGQYSKDFHRAEAASAGST